MPRYNYICKDCLAFTEKKLGREATEEEQSTLVFEAVHGMFPTVEEVLKATQCPFCDGHNVVKTFLGVTIDYRVRGGDWREFRKNNAAALQRDMALHQLEHDDPYGYMRKPGDKADLADQIRDGRKKKTKKQYFT
jgi:hypothetical protein